MITSVNPATSQKQGDFRLMVKTALLHRDMTITGLAKRINRPRPTVSSALTNPAFRLVRESIARELSLSLPKPKRSH
jgi:hypothetical protein